MQFKLLGLILFLWLVSNVGLGQISFQVPNAFPVDNDPVSIAFGDFNEDGFIDLVTANDDALSDNLSILINDMTAGFDNRTDIGLVNGPGEVKVADVNMDGHDDLLTPISTTDQIAVLLGDGSGNFATPVYFSTGDAPFDLVIGDLNGDTFPDIINSNRNSNDISILLGDGTGVFAAPNNISVGQDPMGIEIGLLNADNFLDVAVMNNDDQNIQLLFGDGSGVFTSSALIPLTAQYSHIELADLNGDGNIDITGDGTSSFFITLGDGLGGFNTPVVYPSYYEAHGGATGDLDGDGNEDAVFWARDFALYVLKGDGTGLLTTDVKLDVSIQPDTNILIVDVDNDGDLDIIMAGVKTVNVLYHVKILINDGSGNFNTPTQYPLLPLSSNFEGAHAIVSGDFNEDGFIDLAATNHEENQLALLFGNGAGQFTQPVVTPTGSDPRDLQKGDFNGDGHLDLITINWISNDLTLFVGDGAGGFTLATTTPTNGNDQYIDIGDFNEDTFLDIVVSGGTGADFTYYLGDGAADFSSSASVTIGNPVFDVRVGDVNNDGHDDIITSYNSLGTVEAWLGDGAANFSTSGTYNIGNGSWLEIEDVDGDGNLDVLSNSQTVLLGLGDGTFNPLDITGFAGGTQPLVADMNNDGQMDLLGNTQTLSSSFGAGKVRVYILDASLNVTESYTKDFVGGFKSVVEDFNQDGLLDIATTDVNYNGIWILLNTTIPPACNPADITSSPSSTTICVGDAVHTITVTATGDAPLSYQWQKDGINASGVSANSASYNINHDKANSGTYRCLVSNACGTAISSEASITILEPVLVTTQPTDQTATIGSDATFTIVATGDNLTYQWQKEQVAITGETSASLIIANVTLTDEGDYTCVVSNSCSSLVSNTAQLTTSDMPISPTSLLTIYNAVAPNGNGKHDYFKIENIELLQDTKVIIYNKWGTKVFEVAGYDNQNPDLRFEGRSNVGSAKELLEGSYYYVISSATENITGFLHLKR